MQDERLRPENPVFFSVQGKMGRYRRLYGSSLVLGFVRHISLIKGGEGRLAHSF